MKTKITASLFSLLLAFSSFSQLDDIYENRKWDLFINATSFSYKSGDTKESFNFIKPFYMRLGTDKTGAGKPHFSWHIPLGSDGLWGALMELSEESSINSLDQFNFYGISSGILGIFQLKFNIIGSDNMVAAAGLEFGDVALGGGWNVIVGPSALVEKAITNSMSVGINMSYSKAVATTNDNLADLWVMSFYPRLLFESGWYVEAGIMTTTGINATYSRMDINFGKSFRW
jgi:hypothetical protein